MPDAQFRQRMGAEIRAVRSQQGLTQAALADRLGLQRTSVTNIEAGDQGLTLETFIDLTAALGVSPEALLTRALLQNSRSDVGPTSRSKPRSSVDEHVERWTDNLISKGQARSQSRLGGRR